VAAQADFVKFLFFRETDSLTDRRLLSSRRHGASEIQVTSGLLLQLEAICLEMYGSEITGASTSLIFY
jgi:hypothetical protein